MSKRLIGLACAAALLALPGAASAETLKIGFITTLSGPAGIIGQDMKQSVELALEQLGGKVGGLDTEIIWGDDQRKTDVAVQLAKQMIERDKVHFVTGVIWSNVLMSIYKPVIDSKTFLISSNAGPSPIAGKLCSPWFFSTSWQNDQTPEAMGKYMQDTGIDNVYIMAPNYQAGKDMLTGFKRYFKGKVVGEVYTKLGQQDYQTEISQLRAAKPDAVFVFYPGGMGISFVKQFAQAGLRDTIPLFSVYTTDSLTLGAQKADALGTLGTMFWSPDLNTPENKSFVAAYKAKHGRFPAFYGAQSYDMIILLDATIKALNGDLSDKDAIRAQLLKADFKSIRGKFKYNTNHFPIQNFYLRKVVQEPDGSYVTKIVATVFEDHGDAYAKDCKMTQ